MLWSNDGTVAIPITSTTTPRWFLPGGTTLSVPDSTIRTNYWNVIENMDEDGVYGAADVLLLIFQGWIRAVQDITLVTENTTNIALQGLHYHDPMGDPGLWVPMAPVADRPTSGDMGHWNWAHHALVNTLVTSNQKNIPPTDDSSRWSDQTSQGGTAANRGTWFNIGGVDPGAAGGIGGSRTPLVDDRPGWVQCIHSKHTAFNTNPGPTNRSMYPRISGVHKIWLACGGNSVFTPGATPQFQIVGELNACLYQEQMPVYFTRRELLKIERQRVSREFVAQGRGLRTGRERA